MQLQDERREMSERNDKLQKDLKAAQDNLQAERDKFLAGIWIEKEASAAIQQELRDNLRDATGDIHLLRGENTRLLSLLQEFEPNYQLCVLCKYLPRNNSAYLALPYSKINALDGQDITHNYFVYEDRSYQPTPEISPRTLRSFPAARSAVELSGNALPPIPSARHLEPQSSPHAHLSSKSMDNIRSRKASKPTFTSAEALAAYPIPRAPQMPLKHRRRKKSSVDADSDSEFQDGHDLLIDQPPLPLPQPQHYSESQSLHHNKFTTITPAPIVCKPRRILKMASSPLLRKNQDRTRQTGKCGPATDILARRQAGQPVRLQKLRAPNDLVCISPWESSSSTSTTNTQAAQANSSDGKGMKRPTRHWWAHGWKLFNSGDV